MTCRPLILEPIPLPLAWNSFKVPVIVNVPLVRVGESIRDSGTLRLPVITKQFYELLLSVGKDFFQF